MLEKANNQLLACSPNWAVSHCSKRFHYLYRPTPLFLQPCIYAKGRCKTRPGSNSSIMKRRISHAFKRCSRENGNSYSCKQRPKQSKQKSKQSKHHGSTILIIWKMVIRIHASRSPSKVSIVVGWWTFWLKKAIWAYKESCRHALKKNIFRFMLLPFSHRFCNKTRPDTRPSAAPLGISTLAPSFFALPSSFPSLLPLSHPIPSLCNPQLLAISQVEKTRFCAFKKMGYGRTDGRTDGPTDGWTDGRTQPLIEMRGRI